MLFTAADAIDRLCHGGEAAASLAGYRCVTERSPGSESTYLHIERRRVWFGIRLSSHPPAYACSGDYEQLLVREAVSADALKRLMRHVAARARLGGAVVANPFRVRRAIRARVAALDDGRRYIDRSRTVWVWSSADRAWRRLQPTGRPGCPPPLHRPKPLVSDRLRSAIRHDQNVLATWEQELSAAASETHG